MRRCLLSIVALLAFAGAGFSADDWIRYLNPRYGYGIDLPPGFSAIHQADNGDGGTSRSADGKSQLSVWGANLLLDTLSSDAQSRVKSAIEDGWEISYKKVTKDWASWSGE